MAHVLTRSWRRFQRRPAGVRLATLVVVILVVAGVTYGLSTKGGNNPPSNPVITQSAQVKALENASTSTVGITSTTITVGFPLVQPGCTRFKSRIRDRCRIHRTGQGDRPVRRPDQQCRWHLRTKNRPRDRQHRSHKRDRHAFGMQELDRGSQRRVRSARRRRELGRNRPTLHHPRGAHPTAQRMDHGSEFRRSPESPISGGPGRTKLRS